MALSQWNRALDQVRRALVQQDDTGLTDSQLLEAYLACRDEAAFASLLHRHGPMVLGVCRRILRNAQDAEDAFQATFLVLVRKASAIVPRERLPNFLYGVAYQTAVKAKALLARRRARERQVEPMPDPEVVPRELWDDLEPLLDQELSRVPEKYRLPILLCDLEGKTRKEAARQLGWPEGTLSSRLARGRTMLARFLTRRGVALSGGALAGVLAKQAASARVPASLAASTVQAARAFAAGQTIVADVAMSRILSLTQGVLKSMLLARLKMVTLGLGLLALLGGTCAAFWPAAGKVQASSQAAQERPASDPKKETNAKDTSIQGVWELRGGWSDSGIWEAERTSIRVIITHSFLIWRLEDKDRSFTYQLDRGHSPKHLDLSSVVPGQNGKTIKAIYAVEGDRLKLCESEGPSRPTDFSPDVGSGRRYYVFQRLQLDEPPPKAAEDKDTRPAKEGIRAVPLNPLPGRPRHRATLPALYLVNRSPVAVPFSVSPGRDPASGLGKADVYLTPDEGRTWRKTQTDESISDKNSVLVRIPQAEITYGVYLVIKSKAGANLNPLPMPGTMPGMRVELDNKPPEAQLFMPKPDPVRKDVLNFQWIATDRNLDPYPIILEYAEEAHGPWKRIGLDALANTGRISWSIPPDTPAKAYLRMRVFDQAGNCSEAVTRHPVVLEWTPPGNDSINILAPR